MIGRRVIGASPALDADARAYIAAVETADGQALEPAVRAAINNFVIGCKSDGIWSAIKSSCILAGARTLNGALRPLVGPAPTNFNFVAGDYNRNTGLVGNGTNKYLNTNRSVTADPINNCHVSQYLSSGSAGLASMGGTTVGATVLGSSNPVAGRLRNTTYTPGTINALPPSFLGFSRTNSSGFTVRSKGAHENITAASADFGATANYGVFRFTDTTYFNSRVAFYSIGEAIDLSKLDTRVSALMAALNGAIA